MGKQYKNQIKNIQGTEMTPRFIYAVLAYILMTLGLLMFVVPNIRPTHGFTDSLKYGLLFGLVVYGIYDMTAAAVLNNWDIKLAFIDILWGSFVYFMAAYIGSLFNA